MKLKKIEISLLVGILFALMAGAVTAFAGDCAQLRADVLRLHILANSDQPFDQQIKLEVRDAVLAELGPALGSGEDKASARREAAALLEQVERIARRVIDGEGYDYPVSAQMVRMYFETRTYGDITMPAGVYDAVRVTIGEARGHNWWCVLYPAVCVPAAAAEEDLQMLREGPVSGQDPRYEPRFMLVELFEQWKLSCFPDADEGKMSPDAVDNRQDSSYNTIGQTDS